MILPPRVLLASARPHIDPCLIPAPQWAALEQLCGQLPAAWSWMTLEVRLQAGADRVDFLVASERHDGRDRLTGHRFPAAWSSAQRLSDAWLSTPGPFDDVQVIWRRHVPLQVRNATLRPSYAEPRGSAIDYLWSLLSIFWRRRLRNIGIPLK